MNSPDLEIVRRSVPSVTTSPAEAGAWHLLGQTDSTGAIRKIPINGTPFTIGRLPGASLQVDSKSISKQHAELIIQNNELWIRDLNSTNGTFVNGEKITALTRLIPGSLMQIATNVFRVGKDETQSAGRTIGEMDVSDQALAMMQFDRLINDGGVIPFYQPIVAMGDQSTIAYEVLGRSRLFGLTTPAEMFVAAQQLNQVCQLSHTFRMLGVQHAHKSGLQSNLFLNTHPEELSSGSLIRSLQSLRQMFPMQAITLEIHEAAVTDSKKTAALRKELDQMSIQLAFDDFGEGQARLVELGEIRPDFLKFDMALTRDIKSASPERQKVVSMIARMVNELGIASLAEGVETEQDHEILCQMGFQYGQGFYYGRPAPAKSYLGHPDE